MFYLKYLNKSIKRPSSSSSSSIFGLLLTLFIFLTAFTNNNQRQLFSYAQDQWNTKDFFKKEHSISKGATSGGVPFWDYVGSTIVTNKFIRLTSDSQSLQGALWNIVPVEMTDWEIQFQFSVHGRGKDQLHGDGFIMWYARDRNVLGPVFGSKDYFHGLAIILDTYSNHNGAHNHPHPYVSAMVNNGSLHYDHDKDGTHTELAGCESQFRNKEYDTYLAVRYHNYKLTVSMDIENKNQWKECFSVDNVRLPTGYYFGFSAATGDLSDNHDIISVRVYKLESDRKFEKIDTSLIEPSAASASQERPHAEDEHTSGVWRFFKILFIILLVTALIVIIFFVTYTVYNKQRKTKKRFY